MKRLAVVLALVLVGTATAVAPTVRSAAQVANAFNFVLLNETIVSG